MRSPAAIVLSLASLACQAAPEPRPETSVEIVYLQHTAARDLSPILSRLASAQRPEDEREMIIENERLNALVISATPERMAEIAMLIAALDVPVPE